MVINLGGPPVFKLQKNGQWWLINLEGLINPDLTFYITCRECILINLKYIQCIYSIMYISYIYIMYILCIYCVHSMYILCIYCVHIMYILCIYYLYVMYMLCIWYVYELDNSNPMFIIPPSQHPA